MNPEEVMFSPEKIKDFISSAMKSSRTVSSTAEDKMSVAYNNKEVELKEFLEMCT